MLAVVHAAAVFGVDTHGVTVEVDANNGLPDWTVAGVYSPPRRAALGRAW
jgi:hypothetical protein